MAGQQLSFSFSRSPPDITLYLISLVILFLFAPGGLPPSPGPAVESPFK